MDFVKNPEKLALPEYAGIGAASWWDDAPINGKCDKGVSDEAIEGVTLVVNGGTNGLDDRIEKTKMIARLLGFSKGHQTFAAMARSRIPLTHAYPASAPHRSHAILPFEGLETFEKSAPFLSIS